MEELVDLVTLRGTVRLRRAVAGDVQQVVALLADDQLGASRDGAADERGLEPYLSAFEAIDADPAHLLLVAVAVLHRDDDDRCADVVATMQLSFLPGLARRGALRAQLEAVRVAAAHRSSGLGTAMVGWAVEEARRRGCALVQLTTDKRRTDAHRFYERLGFAATHEGMKLHLR